MQDFAEAIQKIFDALHAKSVAFPKPLSYHQDSFQEHQKHLHILRYPCPVCSFTTDLKVKLLIPHPDAHFPPNPVLRINPPHLDCGHGYIPSLLTVQWFSHVLQSFTFESGYSLINQNGEIQHFPPQKLPPNS